MKYRILTHTLDEYGYTDDHRAFAIEIPSIEEAVELVAEYLRVDAEDDSLGEVYYTIEPVAEVV
jgi:hypothetical protein